MSHERKTVYVPLLVLMLLSPMTAELLTGSTPPAEFFNPVNLAILMLFYGSAAALIREVWAVMSLAPSSLLLLGAAYGVWEEGLVVGSFFNPEWKDLGVLRGYGRVLGINTVWTAYLTLFHAFYSIALPALFVSSVYAGRASGPWLSRRTVYLLVSGFALSSLLIHVAVGYGLSPRQLAGSLVAVFMLVGVGLKGRASIARCSETFSSSWKEAAWWCGWGFTLFAGMWLLPAAGAPPYVSLAVALLLFLAAYRRLGGMGALRMGVERGRLWGVLVGSTLPMILVSLLSLNLVAPAAYLALLLYVRCSSGRAP